MPIRVSSEQIRAFATRWKDAYTLVAATTALIISGLTFYKTNVYSYDDLEATFAGDIDYNDDRVGNTFAVVNKGNHDAALLEAQTLIWNDHNTNHGPGFHWDAIRVRPGEEFKPVVLKPGEIAVVLLPTDGHAQDYFAKPIYATRMDEQYKQVVFGVRMQSMDSKGNVYTNVYPFDYFKVDVNYQRGPTAAGYFDRSPQRLFVNRDLPPQKVPKYSSEPP